MVDVTPLLIAVMAFGCVSIIIFIVGRYLTSQATMHRRLPIALSTSQGAGLSDSDRAKFFSSFVGGDGRREKIRHRGSDPH